jgi:hypothetical protein
MTSLWNYAQKLLDEPVDSKKSNDLNDASDVERLRSELRIEQQNSKQLARALDEEQLRSRNEISALKRLLIEKEDEIQQLAAERPASATSATSAADSAALEHANDREQKLKRKLDSVTASARRLEAVLKDVAELVPRSGSQSPEGIVAALHAFIDDLKKADVDAKSRLAVSMEQIRQLEARAVKSTNECAELRGGLTAATTRIEEQHRRIEQLQSDSSRDDVIVERQRTAELQREIVDLKAQLASRSQSDTTTSNIANELTALRATAAAQREHSDASTAALRAARDEAVRAREDAEQKCAELRAKVRLCWCCVC